MEVEMSLAESLMNAIAHGRVHGLTFKRNTDDRTTFADLQRVIGSSLDATRRVAREQALRKLADEHPHFKLRALVAELADVPCIRDSDGCHETHPAPCLYCRARKALGRK